MLHIALCDDNIDELSTMVTLLGEYKESKPIQFEYAVYHNGLELIPILEKGKK